MEAGNAGFLRPIDSVERLKRLGYSFYVYVDPPSEPERSEIAIDEYLPGLGEVAPWLRDKRLYSHQLEALSALEEGKNVVLVAGTGSGKTEAWVFYALKKAQSTEASFIALYPTLALANDQVRRVEAYSRRYGVRVVKLDRGTKDELRSLRGGSGLRGVVSASRIILTNPAFLLSDLKRFVERQSKAYLYQVLRSLELLVIDELDFYSPRSIALLLAMLRILYENLRRPRHVAVLAAGLANPEDVCSFLSQLNGRDCVVVRGRPFNVENRTIVVLGKDLRGLWERAREAARSLDQAKLDRDVQEALREFEAFERRAFRVVNYLRSLGVDLPLPAFSAEEVIGQYVEDEGVTLAFTRSINRAEELYRSIATTLGKGEAIAVHHHLVDRKRREEIEEGARKGLVKIIISPRTLSQGIDIGTVVRVVHVGLPEEVREYRQREGRKGRREGIAFTESIILPQGVFDWSLLSKGEEAFRKWLGLPLEKTVVVTTNRYIHLFTGLAKLRSTWMEKRLTPEEEEALRKTGVLEREGRVNERRLERVWLFMNFYEYAPPYGVPRSLIEEDGRERVLEPVGRCDLVEKFQAGCFDLGSGGMVVRLERGRGRIVSRIIESPLSYRLLTSVDAFAEALEQYRDIKLRWGEHPDVLRDLFRARLLSTVDTVVYPPRQGFGELVKIPNRVTWIIRSERPRLVRLGESHHVVFDQRRVVLPVNTFGEYRDFTTGFVIEASEGEDPIILRLGLAFLVLVLRRVYSLPINCLEYSVEGVGGKTFFEVHEPDSSGLLEGLDWLDVKKAVESYAPDELDLLLLSQVDDIAWTDMLTLNLSWEHARRGAVRVVEYILLRDRVKALFSGREFLVPRPSKALKTLAMEVVAYREEEASGVPENRVFLVTFDGEDYRAVWFSAPALRGVVPPAEARAVEAEAWEKAVYEGYRIVVPSLLTALRSTDLCGLRGLKSLLENPSVPKADISMMLEERGVSPGSIDLVVRTGGPGEAQEAWVPFDEVHLSIVRFREGRNEKEARRLLELLKRRVKAIYLLYHVLLQLKPKTSLTHA